MIKLKQILVCLCMVLGAYANAQEDSIVAEQYGVRGSKIAIFPATTFAFLRAYNRFTPTKQDVDKAELALHTQLAKLDSGKRRDPFIYKHLRKYARQYFGYTDSAGHRILQINCAYMDKDFKEEFGKDFLRGIIDPCDGGNYYWTVSYDLDTGKLFGLYIHGIA